MFRNDEYILRIYFIRIVTLMPTIEMEFGRRLATSYSHFTRPIEYQCS